jgi:hypothetical protein
MLGLGLALGLSRPRVTSGGGSVAGSTRPDFSSLGLSQLFLYHPHTDTVGKTGAQVTTVTGAGGSPNLTTSGTGPDEVTYANGLKAWRFEDTDWLDLPTSFASSTRSLTVIMVGRMHKSQTTVNFFGHSFQSDGVTVANTLGGFMSCAVNTNSAPFLKCGGIYTHTDAANAKFGVMGSQVSVVGVASRTTANGGCRWFNSGNTMTTAQIGTSIVGAKGGRIGGYLNSNGSTNGFDLLCMVAFDGELTNTQFDNACALLMSHYSVSTFTKNYVIEGDSIDDGITLVTSGSTVSMAITEPGLGLIPADVRVLNMAKSGSQVIAAAQNMTTRRDATNGWPAILVSGGSTNNRLFYQIGRNDSAAGGLNETQIRDRIVTFNSEVTTGMFARGWNVTVGVNIANGSMAVIGPLRTLIRDATFMTLHDAQAGGANDGRLATLELPFIEYAGARRFDLSTDTADTTYYQDTTHPGILGTAVMGTGGTTPQYGIASVY